MNQYIHPSPHPPQALLGWLLQMCNEIEAIKGHRFSPSKIRPMRFQECSSITPV